MSDNHDLISSTLERVPSGLPGLDDLLLGGFFRGGVYMILAPPGAGKTILGNQICYRHVAAGGRALFVTLLTESHARLIASLRTMAFFDPSRIGAALAYVTAYQALEKEGLKGLSSLLRQIIRDSKPSLLVVDGFVTAGSMAESELETKKFIHELQVFAELVGCTTILLTGADQIGGPYALRTMVDGLVELHLESLGMEAMRTIEVTKFRGSAILMGRHPFTITEAGLTVYPRIESKMGRAPERPYQTPSRRASFGIQGLDEMFGGGLRPGSITMVLGAPGSGKTLLGLSLVATGAKQGERGLYFSFFETPTELRRRAEAIGVHLGDPEKRGLVDIVWQSPLDAVADALVERVVTTVRERGVKRLVIDGLGGFKDSIVHPERSKRFFGALCSELRSTGVVTVLTDESRSLGEIEVPEHGLTALLDNVVFLRHVEVLSRLYKLLSFMKTRDVPGDPSQREYSITANGFVVASDSKTADSILAGRGHDGRSTPDAPRRRSVKRKPSGRKRGRSRQIK